MSAREQLAALRTELNELAERVQVLRAARLVQLAAARRSDVDPARAAPGASESVEDRGRSGEGVARPWGEAVAC